MKIRLKVFLIIASITPHRCKEPELPLCPTNIQFLPQNLPMHCRMPREGELQNPMGGQMMPMPVLPPGLPSGPMPVPMSMPMPMMPMPMPAMGPTPKVPVIVMPFYSPDPAHKIPPGKRPHFPKRHYYSDTSSDTDRSSDTSSDSSHENRGWWRGNRGFRRNGRRFNRKHKAKRMRYNRRALLTPVLQYVTKDGYVIYEKKITKDEAKDWLSVRKEMPGEGNENDGIEQDLTELRNIEIQFQGLEDDENVREIQTEKREKNIEEAEEAKPQKITARKHRTHNIKSKKSDHQK
ncbi:unnamed protein product [Chilo suppressalis]|uniref:Uncharacterized protein n=1 Tax=Chilo suppressalis TaxID=168631 RepID=A0ABN8AY87_CHISP|nr:unnamed protein product [Chilo suppressalis]